MTQGRIIYTLCLIYAQNIQEITIVFSKYGFVLPGLRFCTTSEVPPVENRCLREFRGLNNARRTDLI